MPLWHDPATVRVLCGVVDSIVQDDITRGEFDEFVEKALGGGDFAKGCENFVDMCVAYSSSQKAYAPISTTKGSSVCGSGCCPRPYTP